jgi:hypothetical protein
VWSEQTLLVKECTNKGTNVGYSIALCCTALYYIVLCFVLELSCCVIYMYYEGSSAGCAQKSYLLENALLCKCSNICIQYCIVIKIE